MKHTLLAAVAIAATAFAGAALAETAPNGWYLSGRTGLATMNDPQFTITASPDVVVTHLKTKNAWAIAGEGGYRYNNWRFGAEVSYQKHDIDGVEFNTVNGTAITPADIADGEDFLVDNGLLDPSDLAGITTSGTTIHSDSSFAELRQIGVMANLSYDFANSSPITPYVTGGLGVVDTRIEAVGEGDNATRFAWQVGAGAAVNVSPMVQLTADYRYREVASGDLGDVLGANLRLGKQSSHFVGVGLRANF